MRRVVIVGCPGSGQSTLAREMGKRLALPVIHLDRLYWRAGWRAVGDTEMRAAVDAASMAEAWISESLAIDSSALRLCRADTIVWLDMPRLTCLRRAVLRVPLNRGRARSDLPEGCPEKFDLTFYRWIWRFDRDVRPRLSAAIRRFGGNARVVRLSSDPEVAAFVSALPGTVIGPNSGTGSFQVTDPQREEIGRWQWPELSLRARRQESSERHPSRSMVQPCTARHVRQNSRPIN